MSIKGRIILEDRIRTTHNLLVEGLRNAELPGGAARDHLKKALEHLALAQVEMKVPKSK